jgi:hypothetical protein
MMPEDQPISMSGVLEMYGNQSSPHSTRIQTLETINRYSHIDQTVLEIQTDANPEQKENALVPIHSNRYAETENAVNRNTYGQKRQRKIPWI